ncbi:unnamed protein product [Ixodes persulcatus]
MVTLKTPLAKKKLVDAASFEAKGRRCVVIDPEKAEVRLKLHWIPFHLPDETVKKALEPYGKVEDVARETWRVGGFEGVQSTTRVVRLTLREDVTLEKLPHQLRLPGCTALVLARVELRSALGAVEPATFVGSAECRAARAAAVSDTYATTARKPMQTWLTAALRMTPRSSSWTRMKLRTRQAETRRAANLRTGPDHRGRPTTRDVHHGRAPRRQHGHPETGERRRRTRFGPPGRPARTRLFQPGVNPGCR